MEYSPIPFLLEGPDFESIHLTLAGVYIPPDFIHNISYDVTPTCSVLKIKFYTEGYRYFPFYGIGYIQCQNTWGRLDYQIDHYTMEYMAYVQYEVSARVQSPVPMCPLCASLAHRYGTPPGTPLPGAPHLLF